MLRQMSVSVSRRPFPHASRWRKPTTSYASSTLTSSTSALETIFPIWNQPKIESFGDYRQEAWLESHIGGPLYEAQASLPRLPVPEIAATLTKFLPTALPLARTNEEAAKLQAAVAKFPTQAAGLQQRLLARANEYHDSSWLQHWWNTEGYLKVRDPVVHNVSYFFQFADDPAASTSITRAAALLQAAAGFRVKVGTGALPQERIGKQATPLCSTAYKYMFHATRIPRPHHDSYAIYDPSQYAHAVVARKGYFFALDFCCPSTGKPYSLAALQDGLQSIVEQADQLATEGRQPHLGWLTSSQRDDWAKARQTLLDVGGEAMREALEVLQSGALMICLDDERPVSRREAAQLCLHGTVSSGHNRWFDKSIQLLVSENGKAGLLGEHSMMDGMPMVGLADELTKSTYGRCDHDTAHGECRPRAIFGNIKHDVGVVMEPLIEKAKDDFTDLVIKHELHVQSFHGYGSDFIKQAGYSPDAYVQMAMQLATYRLWSEQAGTYEATQVRPFLHGRTETTRTVSEESAAFCAAMGLSPKHDEHHDEKRKDKLHLLQAAVNAHVKYIGNAAKAQGVDRHFFGLSMLVGDGEKAPDLYSDPVFIRSKRWRVSTRSFDAPSLCQLGLRRSFPGWSRPCILDSSPTLRLQCDGS